jgi:hypothetical protein
VLQTENVEDWEKVEFAECKKSKGPSKGRVVYKLSSFNIGDQVYFNSS